MVVVVGCLSMCVYMNMPYTSHTLLYREVYRSRVYLKTNWGQYRVFSRQFLRKLEALRGIFRRKSCISSKKKNSTDIDVSRRRNHDGRCFNFRKTFFSQSYYPQRYWINCPAQTTYIKHTSCDMNHRIASLSGDA